VGVHIFFENNHARVAITQPKDMFFYADYRASMHLDAEYLDAHWLVEQPDYKNGE
jgi:hypothetical protein